MSKLPLGIIAMLGVGIGAFVLSKRSKDTIETQQPPVITPPVITPTPTPVTQTPVIEDPIIVAPIIRDEILTISSIDLFGFIGKKYVNKPIKFFSNTNTSIGVLTYDWDFGDGAISSGTTKQYTNNTYANEGQYKVILTVTNNFGESVTKSKIITISPNPVKEGDVTSKVLAQPNSVLIRLTNNHSDDLTGSFTVKVTGANTKTFSSITHINGKQSIEIIIDGLNSGYSQFNIDFKPNGSSKDVVIDDNETIFIYDLIVEDTPNVPVVVVDDSCKLSSEVQSILFQLDTVLNAPTWFITGNVKDIRECNISEEVFINSYYTLLSSGVITAK